MKYRYSGRTHDRLIDRLERKEKKESIRRDRFFKFKLSEIHNKVSQALLLNKIIETENPQAISDLIMQGLNKAYKTSEFDFKYFIAPIRNVVPRPNPYSLYLTQYLLEVMIDNPNVIDIYGTDLEIYKLIDGIISQINERFERAEQEVFKQLSHNKSLIPGSRDYEIALEQLFSKKIGAGERSPK
ncbi:MAG: hypothetical protein DRG87_05375 [Deltaproteobacteria bacterium]|nr:DUF507 family protein [Deltaproteobacteria bacterium]MBW2076343.1 DUF507 family protein [Deltaproteobacteria bacterium]MBW2311347.1 DUF507 family protein [Deltaproteobacteria bacterium]RLB30340.1 MAG: hypothetical protein DRG87_05375 [Deltaproteobacteria bacterium]